MLRRSALVLASCSLATALLGCVAIPPTPTGPAGSPATNQPVGLGPTPGAASTVPSSAFGRLPECPAFRFDDGAKLGPVFQTDIFQHDESHDLAAVFVEELQGLYAGSSDVNACDSFSRRGLQSALTTDSRLGAVAAGTLRIEGDLVLRAAFEGDYDLRKRPPTVPLDLVFDLLPPSTVTNLVTGGVDVTRAPQRWGENVTFTFDGHRWLADRVGPISAGSHEFAELPTAPPPGPPCARVPHDPPGAAFDEGAGAALGEVEPHRAWCDGDGLGRLIAVPDLLEFHTRYPCDRGSIALLALGSPLGTRLDPLVHREYLRDPKGEARAQAWLSGDYLAHTVLPADAVATGWTNGNIDLWTSPPDGESAIYVQRGQTIERWPRAADERGVTDCN